MKNKRNVLFSLMVMLTTVCFSVQTQQRNFAKDDTQTAIASTAHAPVSIVRTIICDNDGNIWLASWEGVFKYDGKTFTNVTANVSSARFFSVLQDRKGNFWFASIGSGVYYYDPSAANRSGGKTFQNFTTKDGLASDRVGAIYEDKDGNIWFGTEKGASLYDGKSFRNFKMKESPAVASSDSVYTGPASSAAATDSVHVSSFQNQIPENSWTHNDVNAVIEDNTGKLWFATRGYSSIYDGKSFTTINNNDGKPFTNVRCIIKDKKGNIWLGGHEGLWKYNGKTFSQLSRKFTGYIYEDKKGNIWTSSESATAGTWVLSRYDQLSLTDDKPTITEIAHKPMIFGISEDRQGNIWFGSVAGVYRYDGKTINTFWK